MRSSTTEAQCRSESLDIERAPDPVTGEGRAYGWYGNATPRAYMIETPVVVGRVWR